jgi:hypothetical protein
VPTEILSVDGWRRLKMNRLKMCRLKYCRLTDGAILMEVAPENEWLFFEEAGYLGEEYGYREMCFFHCFVDVELLMIIWRF